MYLQLWRNDAFEGLIQPLWHILQGTFIKSATFLVRNKWQLKIHEYSMRQAPSEWGVELRTFSPQWIGKLFGANPREENMQKFSIALCGKLHFRTVDSIEAGIWIPNFILKNINLQRAPHKVFLYKGSMDPRTIIKAGNVNTYTTCVTRHNWLKLLNKGQLCSSS